MEKKRPPIRVLCPGRVYRNEAISARAHCFFHQIEGLYVDKGVSFADLREVLLFFAREFFGEKTEIRLRPSYFPSLNPVQKWMSRAIFAMVKDADFVSILAG